MKVVWFVFAIVIVVLLFVARKESSGRHDQDIEEIAMGHIVYKSNLSQKLRASVEEDTTMLRSAPIRINEKQLDDAPVQLDDAPVDTAADTTADTIDTVIDTTVPAPKKIDIELAVIVLSALNYKERREVIRETWGNGHSNLFFIIGKHCPYRPDQRKPWVCEPKNANAKIDIEYNAQQEALTQKISQESNVIIVDMIDVYRNLADKLFKSYRWIIQNTNAKYVLKMDDDSFARVGSVEHWLKKRPHPPKYEIIAGGFSKGPVSRRGKWAEMKYKPDKYPPWPSGAGHIVSRPVIEYMHQNADTWVSYQGEDTSLGIWMENVRPQMNVQRTNSEHFITHSGDCHNKNKFVIGHSISLQKMRECYNTMDEYEHVTTSQAVTTSQGVCSRGIPMDPFNLLRNHWDIIVKAVYASAYLSSNKIPEKISETYSKLNFAWGGGHEKCDRAHNPTQLTHPNCVPKNSIRDFETSFRSTIDSMNKNGFDSTKGLVPVIPVGNVFFAINGAHRIGAAIATKNHVCVEKVNLREHNWDEKFFRKKNVPNSDIIMRHWANLDKKMIVIIINPKAVMLASKMDQVRKIIDDCSDTKSIIFEKNFPVDSSRMQTVLSTAYGDEQWFKNLELEKYASGFLTKRNPTCKFFVIHGTQENMKNCKLRIRNVFDFKPSGNFKKSCHIGDNYAQHLRMVNYVLSDENNNKRVSQVIKTDNPEDVWDTINSDISIQSNIDWSGEKTASDAFYSRTIYLSNQGAKSLAQHLFNEKHIPSIHLTGDDQLKKPITVSFFDSNKCNHNCLTHIQTRVLAQMTLNDNSIMFLNRHDGKNCKDVAYELASRLGLKPTVGTFFQFPSDIMIESGAVMSFFGLRKRTDIDVISEHGVDTSLLGWKGKILVEEHKIKIHGPIHGRPSTELLSNPSYFGYCHGLKFVSLEQLRRYKLKRGEVNKASREKDWGDAKKIESFLQVNSALQEPSQEPQSGLSGKVYICGYKKMATYIAENVFSDFHQAGLIHKATVSTERDIMVVGIMFGACEKDVTKSFNGKRLYVNGEPNNYAKVPRGSYIIGPSADSANSLRVYFVAMVANRFKNWRDVLAPRIPHVPPKTVLYVASKCYSNREEAFRQLHNIMHVYAGGSCHGQLKENEYTRVSIPPRSSWETAVESYSDYRFGLVLDSTKKSGFISEKILVAFMGGTVPIYFGTTEVFDIFNERAFIYYDVENPQPALDRIAYLEKNQTAYLEVFSQPILLHGAQTLERYFSLSDAVGNGKLKKRIRDMVLDVTHPAAQKPSPVRKPLTWISLAICLDENVQIHDKAHFPYADAIVLAAQSWEVNTGSKVLVQIVSKRNDISADPLVRRLRNANANVWHRNSIPGYSCVTSAQILRMFAYDYADILDNDIIITADADAFPLRRAVLSPLKDTSYDAWVFQHYYSESSGYTFPMSFVALRKKGWNNLFSCAVHSSVTLKQISKCIGQYGLSPDSSPKKIWGLDQRILTRALLDKKVCSVTNKQVWKTVGLSYSPFDDSTRCFHGQSVNGHGRMNPTKRDWIHMMRTTTIAEVKSVLALPVSPDEMAIALIDETRFNSMCATIEYIISLVSKVELWFTIRSGTLLAAVRNHGCILDRDIDIQILDKDADTWLEILQTVITDAQLGHRLRLLKWGHKYEAPEYPIVNPNTNSKENKDPWYTGASGTKAGILFRLMVIGKDGKMVDQPHVDFYSGRELSPPPRELCRFGNVDTWCPSEPTKVLIKKYGKSWRIPNLYNYPMTKLIFENAPQTYFDNLVLSAPPPMRKPLTWFLTYGNSKFTASKKRIAKEAVKSGWFDDVIVLGPENMNPEFRTQYADILEKPRIGGYGVWRHTIIIETISKMNDGDFLVYLDAGCTINTAGKSRFDEYLNMLKASEYDILSMQLKSKEYQYTNHRIFEFFNISKTSPIYNSGMLADGILIMQKGEHLTQFLKGVESALQFDRWLFSDNYNEETKRIEPRFKDNRHEQSVMSVVRKMIGSNVIRDETWATDGFKSSWPFWATRIRG
jgi:hypothetical protein